MVLFIRLYNFEEKFIKYKNEVKLANDLRLLTLNESLAYSLATIQQRYNRYLDNVR